MMKRILLYLLFFSLGAGSYYFYIKNNNCFEAHRKNRGSLESLRNRGIRSLTRLETKLRTNMSHFPKQASQLQELSSGVADLKEKFNGLISNPAHENRDHLRQGFGQRNQSLRYPEDSIASIRSQGISTLSMLEAMVDRRLHARAEQPEDVLLALSNEILELKQQFKALSH